MSVRTDTAAQAEIGAAARDLHLPTIRDEAGRLAEIAVRERQTHLGYLAEVLSAEVDDRAERRRARLIVRTSVMRGVLELNRTVSVESCAKERHLRPRSVAAAVSQQSSHHRKT